MRALAAEAHADGDEHLAAVLLDGANEVARLRRKLTAALALLEDSITETELRIANLEYSGSPIKWWREQLREVDDNEVREAGR